LRLITLKHGLAMKGKSLHVGNADLVMKD